MARRFRSNTRGFAWIPWVILLISLAMLAYGFFGFFKIASAPSFLYRAEAIAEFGWTTQYIDSYFLMSVICAIWLQVISMAADNEEYLISIEEKLDRLGNLGGSIYEGQETMTGLGTRQFYKSFMIEVFEQGCKVNGTRFESVETAKKWIDSLDKVRL